jgi:peroxiredoxin
MNKKIIISALLIVVLTVLAMNYSYIKHEYMIYSITTDMFVDVDNDQFDPGPKLGEKIVSINALYNGEIIQDLTSLSGSKGMVLVINRSLDWCPFCMRQTIQLQEYKEQFDTAGINIVVITYDDPILQKQFTDRHSIDLPILSDIEAQTFKSLSVLRKEYKLDDNHYGLPYPGMIIIDTDGFIRGKLFVEAYSSRVDSKAVLDYAKAHLLE